MSVKFYLEVIQQKQQDECKYSCIEKGCTDTADYYIVGNKKVGLYDYLPKSGQYFLDR